MSLIKSSLQNPKQSSRPSNHSNFNPKTKLRKTGQISKKRTKENQRTYQRHSHSNRAKLNNPNRTIRSNARKLLRPIKTNPLLNPTQLKKHEPKIHSRKATPQSNHRHQWRALFSDPKKFIKILSNNFLNRLSEQPKEQPATHPESTW